MLQFDVQFYLSTYPDVAAAISRGTIASAQDHYNNFGRFESRNPSAFFDTAFYLSQNPDVAAARVNPFTHFLQFGAAEGRFANNTADVAIDSNNNNRADEFNSAAYLAANPDVAANVGTGKFFATAYQHYILFGQFETTRTGVPAGGPFTNSGIAPNQGGVFTLTAGADTLTPTSATAALQTTANNDTFRATTAGDLSTADFINGGGGVDTINAVATFATTPTAIAPQLTSVEIVNLTASGGGADGDSIIFSGANSTGIQQVWSVNSVGNNTAAETSNVVVNNISTGVTVGIEGGSLGTSGTLNSGLTAVFTNVTGTSDSANLALKGAKANVVTVAGIETLNVATSGAASTVATLTAAQLTSLKVTGASDLTITNGINFADAADVNAIDGTIDASTFTGKLNVTVGGTGDNVSVIGGTNNDRIAFATGEFTALDKVDGGAGIDTLAISAANAVTITGLSATDAAKFQVSNIERIGITTATTASDVIDLDKFSVKNYIDFEAAATATTTVSNLANGGTVELSVASNGLTVGVKDAAAAGNVNDSFTLNLNGTATGGTVAFGAVAAANVETVTVNSTSVTAATALVAADANSVSLTAANLQKLVVTGNVFADLSGAALTSGSLASVDATASTGGVSVTTAGATQGVRFDLSSKADIVVGGNGADIINAGAGNDTINGGAGIDVIDVGTGDDTVIFNNAFAAGNANHDVISNFTFGTASADKYDIGFALSNGTGVFAAGTGATATIAAVAPVAVLNNGQATANDVLFTFSGAGDKLAADTTASNAVANAVTALTSGVDFAAANVATADSFVVALDNGTDTFIFHYVADATAATTSAADLELVGIVRGQLANQIVTGDFI